MNQSAEESLMALLEAMLTLAAGAEARRQPPKPAVTPGGFPEDQFLDLTEEEREELTCSICYQILKESMQCTNEHKFCHSCLVVWSTTGEYANRIKCPVCRTRGIYFRNDDIDTKVSNKRVKCHLDSCTWTGLVKYLPSHRHNTYGEDSTTDATNQETEANSSSSVPRLEQVIPVVPPATIARFSGTGLTTRGLRLNGATENEAPFSLPTPRASLLPGRVPSSTAASSSNTTVSSTNSHETVIDIGRLRGRRNSNTTNISAANTNTTGTTRTNISRRTVPPVRAAGNSRITFAHTRANAANASTNINDTNTTESVSTGAGAVRSPLSRASIASTNESVEGIPNSITGGFTPRPPSAPRTNTIPANPRRLPRILNPVPQQQSQNRLGLQASSPLSENLPSNSSLNDTAAQNSTGMSNIRHNLQDSRNRLNNLMSSFTSEFDRNRQEMMQFQQERESQRREQLEEVRQLSQRLGQVAFELRRLLEHRRRLPSFSDSDSDDAVFGTE